MASANRLVSMVLAEQRTIAFCNHASASVSIGLRVPVSSEGPPATNSASQQACRAHAIGMVVIGVEIETDPFADQARILPRAHVSHAVVPTREYIIVERAATTLKPGEQGLPGGLDQLELHRRSVFCCTTRARSRTRPPATRSPIRTFTTSHPRSLLSMAKSNSARSAGVDVDRARSV